MENNLPEQERALWFLKTSGPQSVKALADTMEITTEGVRFHLVKLEKEGLVTSRSEAEGRGRPKKIWSLTRKGHNRFPDRHADLTVNLIDMMRQTLGQKSVNEVIEANGKRTLSQYIDELQGADTLKERVAKLAEIRSREGYMAEFKEEEEGYLLIENHCPICSAAEKCQGFCRTELNIFQQALGEDANVERVEHIIKGARRCAYRITPNA